jgi:hypothetical protein
VVNLERSKVDDETMEWLYNGPRQPANISSADHTRFSYRLPPILQHQLCTAHPLFLVGYHFVHSFCPPCFPSHRTMRMLCTTFFCSALTNVRSYFYIASSSSVLRHDQSRNLLAHQQLRKKKEKKEPNPPNPSISRKRIKKKTPRRNEKQKKTTRADNAC